MTSTISGASLMESLISDVKPCSKALLALCLGHGKSPCFSGVAFLRLLGVDARVLKLACVDGADFLECAF